MRVLITGVDGYLGWSLSIYLAQRGYQVAGIDNYLRRAWVGEMGSHSAIPIAKMADRLLAYRENLGQNLRFYKGDLTDYNFVLNAYKSFRPDAIVYLGEMPSAPYSMIDVHHAVFTQTNNLLGTLVTLHAIREVVPDCHLIKLGTMGEYGTPEIDIEEGWLEVEHKGRRQKFLYPRQAGSLYHTTKIMDTDLLWFYVRTWQLRVTDLMQGPVYGIFTEENRSHENLYPFLNYDELFGTVLNRFVIQAVADYPMTVYGKGGQTRGYLNIIDTLNCVRLALENPAAKGEMRILGNVLKHSFHGIFIFVIDK